MITPFWDLVDKSGDCWLWTGYIGRDGYGYRGDGKTRVVHRRAYKELVGPIPEGLTLDHLCRVRHCVNPAHLEPVSSAENVMRGVSPAAMNARREACVNGHPLTPENVYARRGHPKWRECRECRRERVRINDKRRRGHA